MKKSPVLSILGVLLILLSLLTACNRNGARIIRVAHNQGKDHPTHIALLQFEQWVEQATDHKLDVQIFQNELLGGQRETVELTQTGAVDMAVGNISLLESFNKAYSVFNLPYLFNSREHYFSVMNDPQIMHEVYYSTQSAGFVGLTWIDAGSRNFYTTKKFIKTPADLKGLKIRVQQSPTNIKMMELLGGSPTPMNYGDVYTAMQQHVIDGAENNELALTKNKHGEVAKYFSYNQHAMIPDILIVNFKLYKHLNEQFPGVIDEAAKKMTEFQIEAWKEEIEKGIEEAKKMGVQFYYPEIAPFKELVLPLHEELCEDEVIKHFYDLIQEKGVSLK